MKVYFDKENYINYLRNSSVNSIAMDTLRMLKNHLSIHLNFKLDDLSEEEFILHEEFEDGVSPEFTITNGSDLIMRPLNKNSFPDSNGIYLINEDVSSVKNLHVVLIGTLTEEIETLAKLIINDDYSFHDEKIIGKDITPSSPISIEGFPFSTLVVVDRYMFKGPEIGGNVGLFDYNLSKIIEKIYSNKQGNSRLIFIYQVNTRVPRESKEYDEGPDIEKLSKKIKKLLHKYCPAPEMIFIGVPKGQIDDEHDRFIISNYIRIKSGDTYVFYNSEGKLESKATTIDFYSLASRKYRNATTDIVAKLNSICKKTLDEFNKYSKYPETIDKSAVILL